jgi:hypothetical protein
LASCGNIFIALGRYERARDYLQLYSGSDYERALKVEIYLREGKHNEALQELKALSATVENGRQMLEPCLQHRPRTKAETVAVQQLHSGVMAVDDPLSKYSLAAWDSLCNQPDLAFQELRRAIEQNYCAYPQMETDPLLENLRVRPEFAEITFVRHCVPAAFFGAPQTRQVGMKLLARSTGLGGNNCEARSRLRFTQTKAANHRAQDHTIPDAVPTTRIRVCFHLLHSS